MVADSHSDWRFSIFLNGLHSYQAATTIVVHRQNIEETDFCFSAALTVFAVYKKKQSEINPTA